MTAQNAVAADFLQRLGIVETRLQALAPIALSGQTPPDETTGERWEVEQVWAHLCEFIPYWIAQADHVVSRWCGMAIPFGRTKRDPQRIAAIETGRHQAVSELWNDTRADIAQLRTWLQGIDAMSWSAAGLHPTLGEMPLARIVDEFLVGHLEEHARQLDTLERRR